MRLQVFDLNGAPSLMISYCNPAKKYARFNLPADFEFVEASD